MGTSIFDNDIPFHLLSRLPDFYTVAPKKIFLQKKTEAVHETEYYALLGARLATQHEFSNDDSWNMEKLKEVTGGDTISARLCGNPKNDKLKIFCKLLLSSNNIPNLPITEETKAFINRLVTVHFSNTFKKDAKKQKYIMDLCDDIFTEFIYHSKNFYDKQTIDYCDEIIEYKKSILNKKDMISGFFESEYELTDSNSDKIKKTEIYDTYKDYCVSNKVKVENILGRNSFYEQFENKYPLEIYRKTHYTKIKKLDSTSTYHSNTSCHPSDCM